MTYGFFPYVSLTSTQKQIPVQIELATRTQLDTVHTDPKWQTDWSSEYLADPTIDKFAVTTEDGELIALGAYQVQDRKTHVIIVYAESAPHSNSTSIPMKIVNTMESVSFLLPLASNILLTKDVLA